VNSDDDEPRDDRFRLLVESVQDYAICILDAGGRVQTWNTGAEGITGYRRDEIIGQHFSRFYPPDAIALDVPCRELEAACQRGRFEDEGWRLRKDGSRFWANVVFTALRSPTGEHLGFSKITRDLTARREQDEALRQSEERFRLIVEGVHDYAIFMLDPGGRVMSWNTAAERIIGYRADEIVGSHFSRFYPPEAVLREAPERALALARTGSRFEEEDWRVRKDGTRFWANVVITALYDERGGIRGFAKVSRDMTGPRRVEALEDSRRQMNEFLAMLGHELRNPLAPIRNAVAIIRAKGVADPSLEWARDVIERQTAHLGRLVDDLLDVSRITSGKIALRKEPLDLVTLLSSAVEASRPAFEGRGQHLQVTLPATPLMVEGDLTRLSQVLLNLLNNAAKYTPERGHVWVSAKGDHGDIVIRVRDDGIGIPAELLPRVFDLFAQGERALDRAEGGLGIGLTLVRQLVHMHGGRVDASSAGPGQGSEFAVRLPGMPTPPLEQKVMPPPPPVAAEPGGRRRVLVVDDNIDSAESMAMLLSLWGHEARTAADGPSALAAARESLPDVVLLDIGLPGMNGYEVAQQMQRLPGAEPMLLIALTGYGREEDRRRSREAGFAVHLVKPVHPDTLQELFSERPAVRS
jgi:PAS domain S-box-containing protein